MIVISKTTHSTKHLLHTRGQAPRPMVAPNQSNIYRKVEVGVKVSHVTSSSQRNKENESEWEVKDIKFHSKQFLIDSQSSETLHPSYPFTLIFVCVTSVANSFLVFVFIFYPCLAPEPPEDGKKRDTGNDVVLTNSLGQSSLSTNTLY